MTKALCFLCLILLFVSCNIVKEKRVSRSLLGFLPKGDEEIVYLVYQTGIDNYRYELYVQNFKDTTKLFDFYLNDASYKNVSLQMEICNDTLIILRSNYRFAFKNKNAKYKNIFITLDMPPAPTSPSLRQK